MIIMKFGSSSLKDVHSVKHVANIIKNQSFTRKIVVLSAFNSVTNFLLAAIDKALLDEKTIETSIKSILNLHLPYLTEEVMKNPYLKESKKRVYSLINKLKRLLQAISFTDEATLRNRDHILTIGERLSVHIMKGCLNSINISAKAVESDKIGLITTGKWGNGTVDLKTSRKDVHNFFHKIFADYSVPLVTGFFGETDNGKPITFGRGGSDYSAAVLAYLNNAERVEIWKDVDGFLSGSPQIIDKPQLLSTLSYDEAAELSYFGAKILHPRTVEPLQSQSIPIVIRNTYNHKKFGTWINSDSWISKQIIKSVTYDRNISMLRIHGVDIGYTLGLLAKVVSELSKSNINIRSVMTSQTCINLILDSCDLKKGFEYIIKLKIAEIDKIDSIDNIGLVAIVGEGLSKSEEPLKQVIAALSKYNLHTELIVSGASKIAAYFIIKEDNIIQAVQTVHEEIFSKL